MVEGNYLKLHKETAGGNLYYIDYKLKTLISAFYVFGNCPTQLAKTENKRSKEVEIFLIDHDMRQNLCELFNTE